MPQARKQCASHCLHPRRRSPNVPTTQPRPSAKRPAGCGLLRAGRISQQPTTSLHHQLMQQKLVAGRMRCLVHQGERASLYHPQDGWLSAGM